MIDVSKNGDFCYRQGDNLALWRPDSGKFTTLRLKNVDTKQQAKIPWPSGTESLNWPGEIPFTDGGTYMMSRGGAIMVLTLHKVPGDLSKLVQQAAWMAGKRCRQQAKLLIISADVDITID